MSVTNRPNKSNHDSTVIAGTLSLLLLLAACQEAEPPVAPVTLETLSIHEISPGSGPPAGGNQVSIAGRGFQAGATVTFVDVDALGQFHEMAARDVRVLSSTSIAAIVPPGGSGSVEVWVRNPDGNLYRRANGYQYIDPDEEDPWGY